MSDAVVVENLVVRYDRVVALDGASLSVGAGEALGIVGPNGSGKSTLLKAIAGLLEPSAGRIELFGKRPRSLPNGTIAYVPQVEDVDWSFPVNVRDVVAMGRFPRLGAFRAFGEHDRAAVARALDLVQMTPLASRHIAELSGGQQQRVFIARAIAQEPRIMLLDEPTTGVDAATEEAMRQVVRELVKEGMPVIMSTHHLERAGEWFDRLIVLDRRVLACGTPDEVFASGAYAELHGHMHVHHHGRSHADVPE